MKKSIALLTALLMVLCLAGCGTSETAAPEKSPAESGAAEPETQASQTVPPSPSGEPETGKIIVTDMMGRQITLDAPAERVVALTAADCEILYAIGAGDLLVGRGEYCDYPEEVRDIPAVQSGNETNIEQIIALRPQVVFMSTMAQSLEHVTSLEAAGIKVVESRETSIDGVYYSIGVIGAVTGHDDEAAALIENMNASFAQLSENAPGDGTKTVYFEVSPLEWGLWTAGKNTYMNEIAEMLGYRNVFEDVEGWAEVSEEQVLARNPDYIVTIAMYYGEGPTPVEEIMGRPGWQNVAAVKNGAVFEADADSFTRPGPRLVDAAQAFGDFLAAHK